VLPLETGAEDSDENAEDADEAGGAADETSTHVMHLPAS
jgi:hypothetical protein